MRLVIVKGGRFQVAAVVEGDEVEALRFLRDAPPDMQSSANGMAALFERYALAGRQQLTSAVFHEASKQERIWQFIKGRLRVFCFVDEDETMVVLTHGAIKKTQKADSSEVARAVRMRDEYLHAKVAGTLEWES